MAGGDNDVVYKVSEDDKSDDLLDDEALIKAYNRAVSTNEEWKVGDFCRCVYSVDGLCYEAKVKSVDHDMCVIRYIGYGNEEEVYLSELLPSEGKFARQRQNEQAKRENAHGSPTPPSEDDHGGPAAHGPRTSDGYSQYYHAIPPPPPAAHGDLPNNEEALASMLMSWYMTGYHTGYYQAQVIEKLSGTSCHSGL
ncbi:hypothetical protein HPB50_011699 [Hyalomma asiaticum]|uniref:Uncharacterized protein n=1 Tax=Hyalomma asiaticum TaxID=266040 RepID=A0ACB7SY29_HYAAI|nr:hypothetical protein HPB50_011699 [Hyalomma asiaticum]